MRRNLQDRSNTVRYADVKENLSKDQLASIGAVAIAWNELELFIHIMIGHSLNLPWPMLLEVTTRINGIDGQIEIIRKALPLFSMIEVEKEVLELIENTLSGITTHKRYRDGVIHARVLDAPQEIGEIIQRRGKREEVLLTVTALDALYNILVLLRSECVSVTLILNKLSRHLYVETIAEKRPNKQRLEQDIQVYVTLLREHQSQRLSLPPLPEFPEIFLIPEEKEVSVPNSQNES